MGSAQRLSNHNTLINWGLVNGYGTLITEVDYDKNIVLDIEYPNGYQTYKASHTTGPSKDVALTPWVFTQTREGSDEKTVTVDFIRVWQRRTVS